MKDNPQQKELTIDSVPIEQLGELTVDNLRKICRSAALPTGGKKAELIKRITSAKRGGEYRVIPGGRTLCKYCKDPARIIASRTIKELAGGQVLRQYRLVCQRGRHRFTVNQVE